MNHLPTPNPIMIVEIPLSELTIDKSEFLNNLILSGKCKLYNAPTPVIDDSLLNSPEYQEYLQHTRDTWK